jgi:hypothetical protein
MFQIVAGGNEIKFKENQVIEVFGEIEVILKDMISVLSVIKRELDFFAGVGGSNRIFLFKVFDCILSDLRDLINEFVVFDGRLVQSIEEVPFTLENLRSG